MQSGCGPASFSACGALAEGALALCEEAQAQNRTAHAASRAQKNNARFGMQGTSRPVWPRRVRRALVGTAGGGYQKKSTKKQYETLFFAIMRPLSAAGAIHPVKK